MENTRICKRCLTRDMVSQTEQFQNMRDYIDHLEDEKKAADGLYESRLSICTECELLWDGLCRRCGCFVEMRAAIGSNRCPDEKW